MLDLYPGKKEKEKKIRHCYFQGQCAKTHGSGPNFSPIKQITDVNSVVSEGRTKQSVGFIFAAFAKMI